MNIPDPTSIPSDIVDEFMGYRKRTGHFAYYDSAYLSRLKSDLMDFVVYLNEELQKGAS